MVEGPGLRFRAESALLEHAVELLGDTPRDTAELARRVLGITGGPLAVRHRLVGELLGADARVRHEDGLWRLGARPSAGPVEFDRLKFAVVDVETTGGVAGRGGHIIEIAVVRIENREIVDSFASLVDPGVSISPWITRLTGIRNGMIRGAPTFSSILPEVRGRLDGCVFVAHSAGYDWGFVQHEMRRLGRSVPDGPRLCTVQLTRRLLPGLDRRGLDALARYYGIEIHERHRARGDAIATARCFLRMLDDAERKGWTTWADLAGEPEGGTNDADR
ncbi:MAG: 3'-5' exonuclease [Gemmatimonadota bacterium]|nr:3'-5' exonuclease [Gemmatimonadota bacterium]